MTDKLLHFPPYELLIVTPFVSEILITEKKIFTLGFFISQFNFPFALHIFRCILSHQPAWTQNTHTGIRVWCIRKYIYSTSPARFSTPPTLFFFTPFFSVQRIIGPAGNQVTSIPLEIWYIAERPLPYGFTLNPSPCTRFALPFTLPYDYRIFDLCVDCWYTNILLVLERKKKEKTRDEKKTQGKNPYSAW